MTLNGGYTTGHVRGREYDDDRLLTPHSLWCKQTFQQCFSDRECVLFPLQQQLFDFLDARAHAEEEWLPFAIEFPSELEVVNRLSVHTRTGRELTLFSSTADDAGDRAGHKRRQRESFALLYGPGSLSTQSRMFLATTFRGLRRVFALVEPLQRHVYEIIRAGAPCHLYFDVERESDCVAVSDEVLVSDDSSVENEDSSHGVCPIVTADLPSGAGHGVRRAFRMPQSQYDALVRTAVGVPAHHCRLDCPHRPDNCDVESTLLSELSRFLSHRYASAVTEYRDLPHEFFEEVIVMRSLHSAAASSTASVFLPPTSCGPKSARGSQKFSQHYVIKLRGRCFNDNAATGEFVLQFVDYLQERATECDEVHRRLFFHDAPVALSVLPHLDSGYASSALPFLPRKCVIDTAVYSRNRMMRTLGSCKLHKDAVLRVEKHWRDGILVPCAVPHEADGDTALVVRSLISLPAHTFCSRTRMPVTMTERKSKPKACVATEVSVTRASTSVDEPLLAAIAAELVSWYGSVSGKPCTVGTAKQCGEHYIILPVVGTRFCQHVQREHRSNNVYFVVDMQAKTAVQKCFDPDCCHFRSAPVPLQSLHAEPSKPAPFPAGDAPGSV